MEFKALTETNQLFVDGCHEESLKFTVTVAALHVLGFTALKLKLFLWGNTGNSVEAGGRGGVSVHHHQPHTESYKSQAELSAVGVLPW